MGYTVFVDDNSHYMDESRRYKLGEFGSYDEAVQAAQRIVDEFLVGSHKPGMSVKTLYEAYTTYGEDPFIITSAPSVAGEPGFSAWEYAKQRCKAICGEK